MIGKYVIVRTYSAGVFAGTLESLEGRVAVIRDARRLWRWEGAASISQLAVEGTSSPDDCRFPAPVPRIMVLETIEIDEVTAAAEKVIREVPVWRV